MKTKKPHILSVFALAIWAVILTIPSSTTIGYPVEDAILTSKTEAGFAAVGSELAALVASINAFESQKQVILNEILANQKTDMGLTDAEFLEKYGGQLLGLSNEAMKQQYQKVLDDARGHARGIYSVDGQMREYYPAFNKRLPDKQLREIYQMWYEQAQLAYAATFESNSQLKEQQLQYEEATLKLLRNHKSKGTVEALTVNLKMLDLMSEQLRRLEAIASMHAMAMQHYASAHLGYLNAEASKGFTPYGVLEADQKKVTETGTSQIPEIPRTGKPNKYTEFWGNR